MFRLLSTGTRGLLETDENTEATYVSVHQLAVVLHLIGTVLIRHVSLLCVLVDIRRQLLALQRK